MPGASTLDEVQPHRDPGPSKSGARDDQEPPRPMRLAYFTNRYGSASYTFIMTEVAYLRGRGHSVRTFSVRHPGREEGVSDEVRREQESTEYFLLPGLRLVAVGKILLSVVSILLTRPRRAGAALLLARRTSAPGVKARLKQLGYLALACHLARRMTAHRIEHIHNHLGSSSATIAMLAATLANVPFSLTIHGGQIFYEPRQWALGEKIVRSAFTACISSFCRSQCMLHVPHEAWDRLKIVRCALDERFLGVAIAPLPEAPRLVSVGRLSEEKGQLLLLDAVRRVVGEGIDVRLVLVGDGPMRATLERRITGLGLVGIVRITGLVGADEVRRELAAARAFVLASLTEGLPVSIMEAFAQCRPVVATNVGAIAELVRSGETGWLVSPGSVDELSSALIEVLRAPTSMLTDMARRGAALVAERHRASTQLLALEEYLQEAVRGRDSSTRARTSR